MAIINLIANLKTENADLKTECSRLKENVKEKELEIKKIIEENECLKNIKNDTDNKNQKRDYI